MPARSVARWSVERASVALGRSRPRRSGAAHGRDAPEQGEDEQIRHGASVCGPTIPDARHQETGVRDDR